MKQLLVALLGVLVVSTSAFGQPATTAAPQAASSKKASPQPQPAPNPDIELKMREIEGKRNEAEETLKEIIQQLTGANPAMTAQQRAQAEIEVAKLRPQIKSFEEQLRLLEERVAANASTDGAAERSEKATEGWQDGTQMKLFTLRNARAGEAARIVDQLFGREIHSAAADERTNSLIVRGSPDTLNIIYAIITRLDEADLGGRPPQPAVGSMRALDSGGLPSEAASANLAKQYETKEQQAAALARQIRELQAAPEAHKGPINDLMINLRKSVGEAFAARQQLHQAELAQLQQRTNSIQQSLKTRESLKDQIIERRVKDLLDPNLQWESAQRTTQPPQPAQNQAKWLSQKWVETEPEANSLSNPPAGNLRGDIHAMIWNVLGVSVTEVEGSELKRAGLRHGLLVEKVRPDGPTTMLREGDILVGVHRWVTNSVPALAWCILQPIARDVAVVEPTTRSTAETAKVHVLRGDRIERIDVELQPWEPERRLRSSPSWVGQGSVAPASSSNVIGSAGKATTLMSPTEFRELLFEHEKRLARFKTEDLTKLRGDVESNKKLLEAATQGAERDLRFLREEYAAQLRLLELDVQEAAAAVSTTQQMQKLNQERLSSGQITQDQVLAAERAVQEANLRLQRAKTLLELYHKADPKSSEGDSSPVDAETKPR